MLDLLNTILYRKITLSKNNLSGCSLIILIDLLYIFLFPTFAYHFIKNMKKVKRKHSKRVRKYKVTSIFDALEKNPSLLNLFGEMSFRDLFLAKNNEARGFSK